MKRLVVIETHTGSYVVTEQAEAKSVVTVQPGGASTGGGAWGEIEGTLADQTDLQAALDDKVDDSELSAHIDDTSDPHAAAGYLKNQGTNDGTLAIGGFDNPAIASETFSTALGDSAAASGQFASAIGAYSIASGAGSAALNGEATADGATALGMQSEASVAGSIAIGFGASSAGVDTLVAGVNAVSTANFAVAMGVAANASGSDSVAIGESSVSGGAYSTALGAYASATSVNGIAVGQGAGAHHDHSIALGDNTETTREYEVTIGGSGGNRILAGLLDATLPTDAVNLGQMNSVVAGYQPLDSDLTAIAALTPSNDDFLQRKAGAWTNRTIAQVKNDLSLSGTNTGDQTSIVGITGTLAQFNTACTDADFAPIDSPAFTTVANFLTGANQSRITSDANGPVLMGVNASTYLTIQSYQNIGSYLKLNGYSGIDIFNNATHFGRIIQNDMQLGATSKIGWSSSGIGFAADASVRWLSAGKLAQREGTTAQSYYLYNTYTDSSNNEFGGLRWDTNRFELFTDKLGSGSYRELWILAGNPAGHRLKINGSIIQDYYGGIADARAGINLDSSCQLFAQAGGVISISSANSSMTGQATLQLTSNTHTVTTQIIRPNVKDGGGAYTGAGHHLQITGGKGAAGNNNGGNLDFSGGEKTGSGVNGNIRYGASFGNLIPGATLATTMTEGFFNLPGAAGSPSGVPTSLTGFPVFYNSTSKQLNVYSGGWEVPIARVEVVKNSGAVVGTRKQINFIEGSNITLTVADDAGNNQVDVTIAAAAGSAGNSGTAEIDFGAFPGSNEATVVITGEADILADSEIFTQIAAVATLDHTASDATYAATLVGVSPGNTVVATGFTIYATSAEKMQGKFQVNWQWA